MNMESVRVGFGSRSQLADVLYLAHDNGVCILQLNTVLISSLHYRASRANLLPQPSASGLTALYPRDGKETI